MINLTRRAGTPAVIASCLVVAVGCGDDPAGPESSTIPDIVGTFAGTWQTRVTVVATGAEVEVSCPGSAIIAAQGADGSFTGSWTQIGTTECTAAAGSMTGSVAPGGAVTISDFSNASGRTFEETTGCTTLSGGDGFTGTTNGTEFQISKAIIADCQATEVTFSWTLSATRLP